VETESFFNTNILNEIQMDFIRASGPGGQNVNKVATSVQLRFDIRNSPSLRAEVKARLSKLAGKKVTEDGVLVLEARRYRTQEQNRQDALKRLDSLIQKALIPPPVRKRTRPGASANAARVADKKHRGEAKRRRRLSTEDLE
jgi:ribosome-associated protein